MGGWKRLVPACAAGVLAALLVVAVVAGTSARGGDASRYGPFGPQGPRMREQLWIVPSADPSAPLRATVFRPSEGRQEGSPPQRRPLVVINHGTSEQTRYSTAMPVFYWLSRWFVERGYVVLLPQRRGHGATGGSLIEAVGEAGFRRGERHHCRGDQHGWLGVARTLVPQSAGRARRGQLCRGPGRPRLRAAQCRLRRRQPGRSRRTVREDRPGACPLALLRE
jgi:hypothetical protein